MKIAILASGRGSNFAAIADAVKSGFIPHCKIVGLICNRPEAPCLQLAKDRNVSVTVIQSKGKERSQYEKLLGDELDRLKPDYICLAGYMLVLGEKIVRRWKEKILNIHPSLLPNFPGLHPLKQALDKKVKETGCTVHWVIPTVDAGPILEQGRIEIRTDDTEESLAERLLPIEHATYTKVLRRLAENHVKNARK